MNHEVLNADQLSIFYGSGKGDGTGPGTGGGHGDGSGHATATAWAGSAPSAAQLGGSRRRWRDNYGDGWEAKCRQLYEDEMIGKTTLTYLSAISINSRMRGSLLACSNHPTKQPAICSPNERGRELRQPLISQRGTVFAA